MGVLKQFPSAPKLSAQEKAAAVINKNRSGITTQLFLSFLKVGVIGFGGGSALIPVIEREIVGTRTGMSREDYLKHTVVANITPGALPIKLGATCGYQLAGIPGALLGAYGTMLPGVLMTLVFMALFTSIGERALGYFNYASVGITVFIVFLLSGYIIKTCKGSSRTLNIMLCGISFALTGGGELLHLTKLLGGTYPLVTPLFDISTTSLMLVTFFMIVAVCLVQSKALLTLFALGSLLYCFCMGKTGTLLELHMIGNILFTGMAAVLVLLALRQRKPAKRLQITGFRRPIITAFLFLLIPLLAACAVFFTLSVNEMPSFLRDVTLSTITSFGGGEAYVSVADGVFVQGGYTSAELFYTRLVPVANALPGPILAKIASGIGFLLGAREGCLLTGFALAGVTAFGVTGVCSGIAVLVLHAFDSIRESLFIRSLKQYILPVICGMLLSTSLSMLCESMHITAAKGLTGIPVLTVLLAGIMLLHAVHRKFKLHDIILLAGCAGISFVWLMLV